MNESEARQAELRCALHIVPVSGAGVPLSVSAPLLAGVTACEHAAERKRRYELLKSNFPEQARDSAYK